MRLQSRTWLVIAVLSLVGAAVFWRLGEQRLSNRSGRTPASMGTSPVPAGSTTSSLTSSFRARPGQATLMPAALRDAAGAAADAASRPARRADATAADFRLRNTPRETESLLRDDRVILLRNAVIDTAVGTTLEIPEHLRAGAEPGSYILHLSGPMTPAIRRGLEQAGVAIVSYLPNAAFLVRATAAQAGQLAGYAEVNAVLPYEPYFKILETDLLAAAVRQEPLEETTRLTVTLLPGMYAEGVAALDALGATVVSEFRTPFGPGVVVKPAVDSLAAVARIPAVQGIEVHRARVLLNDLTRERLGISQGTNVPGAFTNHLGLTGTNVFVNVNDSGIDVVHPDLQGRVEGDGAVVLIDFDGHGTHVAGTIAGNGSQSATATNVPGSVIPGADLRGMAPDARLYALPIDLITGPLISDAYLQETAATNYYITRGQTNLLLSNNSWGYLGAFEYTLSAASFDAAVRDALPEVPGSQPIAYVFAAGNEGFGREDGQGGEPSTIRSPGSSKNVITVGALEAPRNITNDVIYLDAEGNPQTNQVFLAETDSDFQITSFSSRGNVEPGVEGRYGRFKPDVVAPGAFIASLRSQDWTDPRAFSSAIVNRYRNQFVSPGSLQHYSLFVPPNAEEFRIRILPNASSPEPFPGLPLYLNYGDLADTADLVNTNNLIRVPPDAALSEGDWFYAVGNLGLNAVGYDLQTIITLTNDYGNYFEELKKLNDGLGPHYRYESGTSMSAPAVTGLLALFQDYFQRENRKTTPALLKALLINGARSVGSLYNFNVRDVINLQGWGLVNLSNSLPATPFGVETGIVHGVHYTDQTGGNALITGESRTWNLSVSSNALDQILKVTLVWTDPPGNPSASVKLVNDLDLFVQEAGTNHYYAGNDIPFRSDFNTLHTDRASITNDTVNNVENIILRPPLSTNYLLTVRASRVNVNAVTEHPDGIAQDFALVLSLENTGLTNSLRVTLPATNELVAVPPLLTPTNGVPMLSKRVGANPERFGVAPGLPPQWTFFVFTNLQMFTPETVGITNGSNVAFSTFLPPNLSRPRLGQADLDLYVSQDPQLTNLVPTVVNSAFRSARPGGTETIAFTNSALGDVFYIGVKAEDQQASEFSFVALSSNLPFEEDDGMGNRIVRGMPFRVAIPDGSADQPQAGYVFGIATSSLRVQRVVVTNTVAFDSTGDLLANLSHNNGYVVLHNHALDPSGLGGVFTGVYDDSAGGDTSIGSILSRPSSGPGSLTGFIGEDSAGLWLLGVSDNALTQTSTNVALTLLITPQPQSDDFLFATLQPGGCEEQSVDVPANATNLLVEVVIVDPPLPVTAAVRRGQLPTLTEYDKLAQILPPGGSLSVGRRDVPPLNAGRYYVAVCNPNSVPVTVGIRIRVQVDSAAISDQAFGLPEPETTADDARVYSTIVVPEDREITDVRVGLRVDHPRVSDLVFHLNSPQGFRLLLSENRGGPGGTAYGATAGFSRIFTTFTDETNLTRTPIKLGIAPFTNNAVASAASNRLVFADGFEEAFPRPYATGEVVAPGWSVTEGSAVVVRVPPGSTNVVEGEQYLLLAGGIVSGVGTNVVLVPGRTYRLRGSFGRLATTGPQGVAVYANGVLVQEILSEVLVPGWFAESVLLTATDARTQIEIRTLDPARGRVPLALDALSLEEADATFGAHYLPEEPLLQPLKGRRSLGEWTLEITDTRAGPAGNAIGEFDWRLEFIFALPPIDAVRLTNDVPYFGTVDGNDIRYFYVETPRCATTSLNLIAGEFATLLLFGDRDGLPLADLETFADDYGPYLNIESGGIAAFNLTTTFPRSAPLQPGQRYYLAVRNYQPDLTNNAFGILVRFDCDDPPFPVLPSLTNNVPLDATIEPGPGLHYYQFIVSSNAISADFELTPRTGNVDLYIRRPQLNEGFPLPSPSRFDYRADNPDPTAIDLVTIDRTSPPEPLVPGVWFIAVRNGETVPVDYTIRVSETYATIVNLTNAVAFTNTIAPVDPFIGLMGADLQYYAFHVSSNSIRAQFETFHADGNVNLYVRQTLPIPTPFDFDLASRNPGILEEFIGVTNTATPIWLTPGWWYLAVENEDVTNVTYTIQATEFPAFIIPLTNNVAVTNVIRPGEELDYYSFPVSPEALSAKFEVYGMSDDVHLLVRQALPVPTYNNFTYASTNAGVADEEIELTPFSFPVGLTPGSWYLSIVNASTNDATYVIRATEEVARVVPLTNAVPYNAAIPPGGDLDYYQFTVSSNATAAEFRLTSASVGNLDLFVRKGPPLPNAANAHYAVATPGVVDEILQIETNSVPIPLSPGIWYLAVTNNEAFPVGYEITATEFVVEPPPISGQIIDRVVTETNICLTWISIPGTNYFVVAKTNALDAVWTPVSPTITAVETNTTWCLAPPGPWRFFDVFEGDSPIHPIPNPVPVLRFDGDNICVAWESVPGTNYFVEAKRLFTDPDWILVTPSFPAVGTTTEVCYPIAWGYRAFRVGVGVRVAPEPVALPPELVQVDATVTTICITWPTQVGLDYLVEGKRRVTDVNWTVISEPYRGDGNPRTLCLDSATEFRYFRVIEGVSVPPGPPPSLPVPNVRLSVDAAFQLCLTWDTLLGAEYYVEGKVRVADPAWTIISPILTATGLELSYCQPLGSVWRYLRVNRVNNPPVGPVMIDGILLSPAGPILQWTGPAGARYQVFYADSLLDAWQPVGGPVTSLDGAFEFLDDESLTGPNPGTRFYRIQRLP